MPKKTAKVTNKKAAVKTYSKLPLGVTHKKATVTTVKKRDKY